ncbi:twin-arginine translocation signal domain-containing protein [Pseudomonas sp. BGr12]|uniref:phosphotriesterase family protein n=1 Tax=Pseudomonas sp. BGr12 TaxID=2936269 RepID=UPI002559A7E8|nr:twin-arginine translocation signal domain-containing protein [Pseudomonas sp. BJa5]MDL2426323.1 twin-arginine translocation signal domain-containing protein [Pseudomonas sp. BJa5]
MKSRSLKSRREFLRMTGTVALAGAAGGLLASCSSEPTPTPGRKVFPAPVAARAGGKNVRTVRGLMAAESLGITDMHEHVLRDKIPGVAESLMMFDAETLKEMAMLADPGEVPDSFFPEKGNPITLKNRGYLTHYYANGEDQFLLDKEMMLGEMQDFATLGGKSILDCSPTYERGSPLVVRQMSEETGVNIIMSTGINSHVLLPAKYKKMNVGELAGFFEKEIFVGIDDTDVHCGHIKLLAESEQFGVKATEDQPLLRGLEAAAKVSRNTGVPVTVHAYLLGTETLKEFLGMATKFGMPKDRMILAHFSTALAPMDFSTLMHNPKAFTPNFDIGYWVMDRGFILSFDLFGSANSWVDSRENLAPSYDPLAMAAIYQYVKAGYGDRIVMGTDLWMRNSARKYGGAGIGQLLNYVVPKLMENGLTQKEIDQILIHTPARMLAF